MQNFSNTESEALCRAARAAWATLLRKANSSTSPAEQRRLRAEACDLAEAVDKLETATKQLTESNHE